MTTLATWTKQWQHFQREIRDDLWGDLAQHTRQRWQDFFDGCHWKRGISIWGYATMNGASSGPTSATGSMSGISSPG